MGAYDEPRYHVNRTIVVSGKTLIGTSASLELLRLRMTEAVNVNSASWCARVGGTAATAVSLTINKSLGGTGSLSAIATKAFTTDANAASGDFDVTATDFADGDHLVVAMAGTGTIEHELDIVIDFKNDF